MARATWAAEDEETLAKARKRVSLKTWPGRAARPFGPSPPCLQRPPAQPSSPARGGLGRGSPQPRRLLLGMEWCGDAWAGRLAPSREASPAGAPVGAEPPDTLRPAPAKASAACGNFGRSWEETQGAEPHRGRGRRRRAPALSGPAGGPGLCGGARRWREAGGGCGAAQGPGVGGRGSRGRGAARCLPKPACAPGRRESLRGGG